MLQTNDVMFSRDSEIDWSSYGQAG